MKWFKVVLRRSREVTIQEEKLVAVSAESEDDLWDRLSEVYQLDPNSEDGWDKDGDGIIADFSPSDEDDADHEVVGEIETDDDHDVCYGEITLPSKTATSPSVAKHGRMALANKPKSDRKAKKRAKR